MRSLMTIMSPSQEYSKQHFFKIRRDCVTKQDILQMGIQFLSFNRQTKYMALFGRNDFSHPLRIISSPDLLALMAPFNCCSPHFDHSWYSWCKHIAKWSFALARDYRNHICLSCESGIALHTTSLINGH